MDVDEDDDFDLDFGDSDPPTRRTFEPLSAGVKLGTPVLENSKLVDDQKKEDAIVLMLTWEGGSMKLDPSKPSIRIGKRPDNDIVVKTSKVSKYHCMIEKGKTLIDSKSKNGTKMAGQKITRVDLKPGDQFEVGLRTFHISNANPPSKPSAASEQQNASSEANAKANSIDVANQPIKNDHSEGSLKFSTTDLPIQTSPTAQADEVTGNEAPTPKERLPRRNNDKRVEEQIPGESEGEAEMKSNKIGLGSDEMEEQNGNGTADDMKGEEKQAGGEKDEAKTMETKQSNADKSSRNNMRKSSSNLSMQSTTEKLINDDFSTLMGSDTSFKDDPDLDIDLGDLDMGDLGEGPSDKKLGTVAEEDSRIVKGLISTHRRPEVVSAVQVPDKSTVELVPTEDEGAQNRMHIAAESNLRDDTTGMSNKRSKTNSQETKPEGSPEEKPEAKKEIKRAPYDEENKEGEGGDDDLADLLDGEASDLLAQLDAQIEQQDVSLKQADVTAQKINDAQNDLQSSRSSVAHSTGSESNKPNINSAMKPITEGRGKEDDEEEKEQELQDEEREDGREEEGEEGKEKDDIEHEIVEETSGSRHDMDAEENEEPEASVPLDECLVQKREGKEGVDEEDEERDEDGEDSSVTHNSGLAVTHERDGESPEVDNGPKANNPSKPKSTPRSIQAILASASTTKGKRSGAHQLKAPTTARRRWSTKSEVKKRRSSTHSTRSSTSTVRRKASLKQHPHATLTSSRGFARSYLGIPKRTKARPVSSQTGVRKEIKVEAVRKEIRVEALKIELEELQKRNHRIENRITSLKFQLQSYEKDDQASMKRLRDANESLRAKNQERKDKIRDTLDSLRVISRGSPTSKASFANTRQAQEDVLAYYREEMVKKRRKYKNALKEHHKLQKHAAACVNQVSNMIKRAKERRDKMCNQRDSKRSEKQDIMDRNRQTQVRITSLLQGRTRFDDLVGKHMHLTEEVESLRNKISSLHKANVSFGAKMKKCEQKLSKFKENRDECEKVLEQGFAARREKTEKMESEKKRLSKIRKKLKSSQRGVLLSVGKKRSGKHVSVVEFVKQLVQKKVGWSQDVLSSNIVGAECILANGEEQARERLGENKRRFELMKQRIQAFVDRDLIIEEEDEEEDGDLDPVEQEQTFGIDC